MEDPAPTLALPRRVEDAQERSEGGGNCAKLERFWH